MRFTIPVNTRTPLFFIMMGMSNAVAFGKFWLLAAILPEASFTLYATAFALATFVGALGSFGLVEATVKQFTQLAYREQYSVLRGNLRAAVSKLVIRHIVIAAPIGIFCFITVLSDLWISVAAGLMLSLTLSLFGLISSSLRALEMLFTLSMAANLRTVAGLAAVVVGSFVLSWEQSFAFETLVYLSISILLLLWIDAYLKQIATIEPEVNFRIRAVSDPYLFVGFLVLAIPLTLDRLWITSVVTIEMAAQYAFAALWIGASYSIASIYVQKAGPDLIRAVEKGVAGGIVTTCVRHLAVVGTMQIVAVCGGLFLCWLISYDAIFLRYELTIPVLVAILLCSATQTTPVLDWAIIACGREKMLMATGLILVAVWCAVTLAILLVAPSTPSLLFAFAAARICQLSVQFATLMSLRTRNHLKHSPPETLSDHTEESI